MIEKGEPWGDPARGRPTSRSRATTPRSRPRSRGHPGAGSRSGPHPTSDLARAVGFRDRRGVRATARHARAAVRRLRVELDDRELFAVNMVVVGVATRPAAVVESSHAGCASRSTAASCTTAPRHAVVVASGQFLRGQRRRPARPPRRRAGRGAGVRADARRTRRRCATGCRTGVHLPHPRHPTQRPGAGSRSRPSARRCPLEVDGVAAGRAAEVARRRGARRPLPCRGLTVPTASRRGPPAGSPPIPSPATGRCHRSVADVATEAETVGVYPSEQFTDDEAAVLRPYFTNLDRPVFALVNLPEVVKGALFAALLAHAQEPAPPVPRRVRRRPRPHRRPHRRRHRRPASAPRSSTTACSSSTATTPSRSSAACTSRASRRRTCSPRSSSGVALMAYLEQSTRYIPYDKKLGGRYRYYRDRAVLADPRARVALHRRHGRAVRHLRRDAPAARSTGRASATRRTRATPTSSTSRRIKAKACDAVARDPARGDAVERRHLRHAARRSRRCCCACARTRCPRRASYAAMMLEELRKVIPSFLARVDRDDRGVAWSAYLAETAPRHRRARRPALRRRASPSRARRSRSPTSIPTPRTSSSPPSATRRRTCPTTRCWPSVRTLGDDERVELLQRVRGRARQPSSPARPRVRTRRLPLRRRRRLRRVPRPATSPHAHHRVATAVARGTATRSPKRSTKPGCRDRSTTRWNVRPSLYDALARSVPRAGAVRGVARVPASASRCR